MKLRNIELEDVNRFVYLGAIVSQQEGMEDREVSVSKTTLIIRRYGSPTIPSRKQKIRLIYKTLVTSVLMYGCET